MVLYRLFSNNKTYLILLLINVFSALGSIILYKIIGIVYTEEDLYVFTFYKRILSFIAPISLLGLGVTLVRKVSVDKKKSNSYTLISILGALIIPLFALIFYIFFPVEFDIVFFAGENLNQMATPFILNLIGLSFFSIYISLLRGLSRFIYASFINLVFIIVIPLILLLFSFSLSNFLNIYGILLILISILLFSTEKIEKFRKEIEIKPFFAEGLNRLIGDISYYFLLLGPSYFLLILTNDLKIAAAVSFCQVILNSTIILIKPISFIKLTYTAQLTNIKNIIDLKKDFYIVALLTFIAYIFIYLILKLSIQFIITFFFSNSILEYLNEINTFLIVVPFFGLYISSRSYLDGVTNKALMSIVNLIGLIIFVISVFIFNRITTSFQSVNISFILCFIIMDVIITILFLKNIKL